MFLKSALDGLPKIRAQLENNGASMNSNGTNKKTKQIMDSNKNFLV